MSFDYAEIADTADELIAEFGQAATLVHQPAGAGSYDTATGTMTQPATVSYIGRGVQSDYKQTDINASFVQQGDQRLLLSALCTDGSAMPQPNTDDNIVVGARTFAVKNAGVIAPAGTIVVYDLHLRGV